MHVGWESNMTIYISQGRYTATAIRAMTAKPENRSEAIAEMLAAAGGRLIGWYLTLGRYDWLIIAEAPDERTLVSAVLAAAAGGSLSDITTTVALSAEDTVKAFGQAGELPRGSDRPEPTITGCRSSWLKTCKTKKRQQRKWNTATSPAFAALGPWAQSQRTGGPL